MIVGVTGHQYLDDQTAWTWIESELNSFLSNVEHPLVGVTSLAIGADQLFAEAILNNGGMLRVIVPFKGYELKFDVGYERNNYYRLIDKAESVETLEQKGSEEEEYMDAGKRVVNVSDFLVAVWDGKPADGLGGTADVIQYTKRQGKAVWHINPVSRTSTWLLSAR